jgi:hypothetical protein
MDFAGGRARAPNARFGFSGGGGGRRPATRSAAPRERTESINGAVKTPLTGPDAALKINPSHHRLGFFGIRPLMDI